MEEMNLLLQNYGKKIGIIPFLLVLIILPNVSAVCMAPYNYEARVTNFNEFSNYVFITLIQNTASGKITYQIVDLENGRLLKNNEDNVLRIKNIYFTEKSNFKGVNLTQVSFPIISTYNVTAPNGSVIKERTDTTGTRYEYYYDFELDKNYSTLNITDNSGIRPCGPKGQNYPELREDYFRIISLDKENPKTNLEKTLWYFENRTIITINSPTKDMKAPTIEVYKEPKETFTEKYEGYFILGLLLLIIIFSFLIIKRNFMGWKKWSSLLKGGLIGICVYTLLWVLYWIDFYTLGSLCIPTNCSSDVGRFIFEIIDFISLPFFFLFGISPNVHSLITELLVGLLSFALTGVLIGIIWNNIKNLKKKYRRSIIGATLALFLLLFVFLSQKDWAYGIFIIVLLLGIIISWKFKPK